MAAVDHYTSITASDITMAAFPFNEPSPFDLWDCVLLDEGPVECPPMPASTGQLPTVGLFPPVVDVGNTGSAHSASYVGCGSGGGGGGGSYVGCGGGGGGGGGNSSTRTGASERGRAEVGHRVAFRTKSEVEIMDDGFKWRKYGKKSVKNSPNPRNYYRCSSEGCSVKKRVERDSKEPSYVITTYEGIHNHTSPDDVYYATRDSESGWFVVSGCRQIP